MKAPPPPPCFGGFLAPDPSRFRLYQQALIVLVWYWLPFLNQVHTNLKSQKLKSKLLIDEKIKKIGKLFLVSEVVSKYCASL